MIKSTKAHVANYFVPPIAFAVAGGHIEIAEYLLQRGAITLPYSALLLHLAACLGQKNLQGQTPRDIALAKGKMDAARNP